MIYLLLALAAVGHVVFWSALVNRIHGLGIQRIWIDAMTVACAAAMAMIPAAMLVWFWGQPADAELSRGPLAAAVWGYLYFCAGVCVLSALHRLWLVRHPERRGALKSNHTTRVDMRSHARDELMGPGISRLLARIPGNEVVDLQIHEKRLLVPHLPPRDDLRIVHLSDFHMSGRVGKTYFVEMAEAVNGLRPDLVLVTGDLVERQKCMDWLPDTLGRLRAEAGVYFVLGNHDLRVDHRQLLANLAKLGMVHLGGTWRQVMVRNMPVVLAGNELPWFGPAPQVANLPVRRDSGLPLRVLLTHGPDQFAWARRHHFDLVLAGHNHGGQVRLPLLGAILAPSLSGTRYAGGVFRRDNTLLHVSRGTGGLTPFRWNCPPEIALLHLISPGSITPGQ